jgi:putative transposase
MRVSRFTTEQIVAALRQAEAGTPVADVCCKLAITETPFYGCKRKFGDLVVTEVRELKRLRDENRKLKTLVAELSLDKTNLRCRRSSESGDAGVASARCRRRRDRRGDPFAAAGP